MEQIGRYQILGEVGRGAMGVVYRAQDPAIGRVIAIKTIRLSDLTDPAERDRLKDRLFREAQSAGILSHPNIVTIYDIAEDRGLAYIFMEFVNGPSLDKLLSEPQPPARDTLVSLFRQTAAALDYAHRKGIVHRDIKPANIMIQEDGQAKITDFGVAKILSHQITLSGAMMGTPNYMSPEQVQGHTVDGRADQFALAVIAYETLTGEKPFVAEYLPSLLFKIVREDPVPPQRLNPTIGPNVEIVLGQALSKNPAQRYPTCGEFIARLVEACNSSGDWQPMPRGKSQSLPTIGGAPDSDHAATAKPDPPRVAVPLPPLPRPPRRDEASEKNPLLRSLVWVLVGIGLVGLVLLGAQKILGTLNSYSDAPKSAEVTPPPKPPPVVAEKPSPFADQHPPEQKPDQKTEPQPEQKPADDDQQKPPAEKPKPPAESKPPVTNGQPPVETPRDSAGQPREPKNDATRSVQMLTEPSGATVTVDGNASLSCQTPCMLNLTNGRHTLRTELPGYRAYPRVFNVPQDGDSFVKLARQAGTLSITSNPPGATIEINGQMQPQKTPANFIQPPGVYHVRVTRDGVPLEFDVELQDQEFKNRNVNFK